LHWDHVANLQLMIERLHGLGSIEHMIVRKRFGLGWGHRLPDKEPGRDNHDGGDAHGDGLSTRGIQEIAQPSLRFGCGR
jgi:hypothetical protein